MLKPIFGIDMGDYPIYMVMIFVGVLAALISLQRTFLFGNYSSFVRKRIRRSFFFAACFGMLGANVANWFLFEGAMAYSLHYRLTQGGFTFIFGLLTYLAFSALFLRLYKVDVKKGLDLAIRPMLLAHFFGRLGCSLRGCCYGIDVIVGDLVFPFPARELEAVFLLIFFFVLNKKWVGDRVKAYMIGYGTFRFVIEYLRGDNRGAIFGITALSPSQIVCLCMILVTCCVIYTRPLMRKLGKEEKLDAFLAKLSPKKSDYTPRPMDYQEPAGTKHPWKVVFTVLLVLVLLGAAFVYINPGNISWVSQLQYDAGQLFAGFFQDSGREEPLGNSSGVEAIELKQTGSVKTAAQALSAVSSYDSWIGADLSHSSTRQLKDGSTLYTFHQTVQGKPVLGSSRALVTDSDGNVLYALGDAASATYTQEILRSYSVGLPTVEAGFGGKVQVLQSMDCWYDTGDGLVAARHVTLSDNGVSARMGAVLNDATGEILCFTGTELGTLSSFEQNSILSALDITYDLASGNDTEGLNALRSQSTSVSTMEKTRLQAEKAIAESYHRSGMTPQDFAQVLESTQAIASATPNLNAQLFADILARQTQQAQLAAGQPAHSAQSTAQAVRDACHSAGVQPRDDESATTLVAQERSATFRHSIDYATDRDVFRIQCQDEHALELSLSTSTPIQAQVYTAGGSAVTSAYLDGSETIMLYPEDGSDFIVRVQGTDPMGSIGDYSIGLQSTPIEEAQAPDFVRQTLYHMNNHYAQSNAVGFLSLVYDSSVSQEEMMALGLVAPMSDQCASCVGLEDGMDTAKTLIATLLLPNAENNQALMLLRGSDLELTYFDHIETDDAVYVKCRARITLDGLDLYNGFSFMELKYISRESIMEEDVAQVAGLFGVRTGEGYYLTNTNASYIYAAFGDTPESIKETTDLDSLYDLWTGYTEDVDGYAIHLKELDRSDAIAAGHPEDKVDAFMRYTRRQNLMSIKQTRANVYTQYCLYSGVGTYGDDATMIYDAVTDPFGTLADAWVEQQDNQDLSNLWDLVNFVTDPGGAIVDEMVDQVIDQSSEMAKELEGTLKKLDAMIAQYS